MAKSINVRTRMCALREEQSINRVFHCSTPGSQDIVADATNRYRV